MCRGRRGPKEGAERKIRSCSSTSALTLASSTRHITLNPPGQAQRWTRLRVAPRRRTVSPSGSLTPHLSCPPRTVSEAPDGHEISRRRLIPLSRSDGAGSNGRFRRDLASAGTPADGWFPPTRSISVAVNRSTGSAKGHEDQFRPPSLSGGCRLGKATFAGTGGKEEDAPKH